MQSSSEGCPEQDLSYAPAFVPIFSEFFSPVMNTCILCIGAWHQPFWMAGSSRKRKRVLITKAETSVREVILHFVSFVNGVYWLLWNRTQVRFRTALRRFFTWVFLTLKLCAWKEEIEHNLSKEVVSDFFLSRFFQHIPLCWAISSF